MTNIFHILSYRYTAFFRTDAHSSVGPENRGSLVRSPAPPIFSPRIADSQCDRTHSSFTAVRCFDNVYVGKQPVAWKEYCVEYWLKVQESMDRCTGRRDITEIQLKTALNTIESIQCIFPL